jgi:hypothetical protein
MVLVSRNSAFYIFHGGLTHYDCIEDFVEPAH